MAENINQSKSWKSEEISTLIDSYEEREYLWNINLEDYKNKVKRIAAIKEISEKLSKPGI